MTRPCPGAAFGPAPGCTGEAPGDGRNGKPARCPACRAERDRERMRAAGKRYRATPKYRAWDRARDAAGRRAA